MKVVHHNDLDGRCAAAIVYQQFPTAEYIEMNYNQRFPVETIEQGEPVHILDFSIQPDEMVALRRKTTDSIVWIDHHKTAIEKFAGFTPAIKGIRRTDRSGAWLTWEFMHPGIEPPEVVRLVDDWDMRTHEKNSEGYRTLQFVAAVKSYDTDPTGLFWAQLLPGNRYYNHQRVDVMVRDGVTIIDYEARQNAEYIKAFGHKFRFEEHTCYACNRGLTNSMLFDSIIEDDEITIFMPFVWDGFKWTVSLYSKTVDVSEIAKKYGGGGHTGAAGFVCDRLPWVSKEVNPNR